MSASPPFALVLASASPRRQELLNSVQATFTVEVADIEEKRGHDEDPDQYVQRLAAEKAGAVRLRQNTATSSSVVIIAADTIVVNGADMTEVLEKPQDFADAQRMWSSLSGSDHVVMTAVCVNAVNLASEPDTPFSSVTELVKSTVKMASITPESMQRYWGSGEPHDKAGGYALQGMASAWVRSISGSSSNIIGLPMYETNNLLRPYQLNWL
ncbi:MAG: Maf family protein [Arenicella sp.]|jgi:septum formation protein|nr:Maf family protein [Arenicella sp.]